MSRIYFADGHDEAFLKGSERAYMGVLISDLTRAVLHGVGRIGGADLEWLAQHLPDGMSTSAAVNVLCGGFGGHIRLFGEEIDGFEFQLNTALTLGGDPLKLAARLHGQCEIHCWVDGADRSWLSDIAQEGLESDIFRQNQGWEGVIAFLRQSAERTVVCSYSVCDIFPTPDFLPSGHAIQQICDADDQLEKFDALTDEHRWRECVSELRARHSLLRMSPSHWGPYRCNSIDAFNLRAMAIK